MRIAIAGTGYVGLSMAVLLAQHNTVTAVDIVPEKADLINRRISPIADSEIQEYLSTRPLDLTATTDGDSAYRNADLVLISTPTNYDPDQNYFDTSSVESVIRQVMAVNPHAAVVIRSTVPVGFTESARVKHGCRRLLFSPEFLREGRALYDNLYPSRIVVGVSQDDSQLRQTAGGLRRPAAGGCRQEGHPRPLHGPHGGGGCQAVRQHLSGPPRQLLQRTGHLRPGPRP